MEVSRSLKVRYLQVEHDVADFLRFSRSERLLVTINLIKTRAILSAEAGQCVTVLCIARLGKKFLRRSGIERSILSHRKSVNEYPISMNHE